MLIRALAQDFDYLEIKFFKLKYWLCIQFLLKVIFVINLHSKSKFSSKALRKILTIGLIEL